MTAEIIPIAKGVEGKEGVLNILREAIADIERGEFPAEKCVVLLLDDSVTEAGIANYNYRVYSGDIRCSEGITLCELAKVKFMRWMGILPD